MKKLRILVPTLMAASLVPLVSMVGCKDKDPEVAQHTITWKCDVDKAISEINPQTMVVDDGVSFADIKKPEIKWNKGFARFDNNWYSDKLCHNPIDSGTIITSDMDIYVKSKELQTFALTWNCSLSGSAQITKPGDSKVYEGTKFKDVIKAEYKANEGYKRSDDKWYSDASCQNEIKPEDTISQKTDIYAKFAKVWNITWTANLPAAIKEIKPSGPTEVEDGTLFENVNKPQYILNEGYRYVSGCEGKWYSDSTCQTEITAQTPITANTTIYVNLESTPVCTITWKASPEGSAIVASPTTDVYEGTLMKDVKAPEYTPQGEYKRVDEKWYSDAECQTEIKLTDPITSTMDIYAKFALIKTITWKANLDEAIKSIDPVTTTFAKGEILKNIGKPVFDLNKGYNRADDFWYSDKACTLPINPRDAVNDDMDIYAKFELTPSAETISIHEGHEATAILGYNLPLACTIKPRTTTQKAITWSSSKQSVATINSSGVVTPISAGTTTIRAAITDNPSIYDECIVTVQENSPLCFKKDPSSTVDSTIKYHIEGQLSGLDIEYKINNEQWTKWDLQSGSNDSNEITIGDNDTLWVRNNVQHLSVGDDFNYFNFVMTGKICASGNTNSLINNSIEAVPGCFYSLFLGCESLTTAPSLPSTVLRGSCYQNMFKGCSQLVSAPELPSLGIPQWGYYGMFKDCKALKEAPELPAPSFADSNQYAYEYMFKGCSSLESAPALPATRLSSQCYYGMFEDCIALKTAPELPATTLTKDCYFWMLAGCKNLTIATEQSNKAHKIFTMVDFDFDLAYSPVRMMFYQCSGSTADPTFGKTYYWVEQ